MTKPVILIVDDEPHVLSALQRDLRAHYQDRYRILRAESGEEALEAVRELDRRNETIALFLVDQRMPGMMGTELLSRAMATYPHAKKALLTAYADNEAAIASINHVGLDYYLMKPWDPPEENLYPVLDELLADWTATAPLRYEGIRVAGTLWSASSHDLKDFLARNRVPYQWLDIETDAAARRLAEATSPGALELPIVFFPDGEAMIRPEVGALADKIGMRTQATQPFYDLIIIGGGPAGLGAAVYAASEGLRTLMVEKAATGGQAGTSAKIENYLGFPKGLSGADLARRATAQASRFGAEILAPQEVVDVRVDDPYRVVCLADGSELTCRALLVATGAVVRRLDVPGCEALTGAGVYYGAAVTEASSYRNRHVFVIGGANSAGQGALFLSRFARRVTIVLRGSSLEQGMSQYLVDQISSRDRIEVRSRTVVTAVQGERTLESITLREEGSGASETVRAAGLFIYIGAVPNTDMVADVVELDSAGFIRTGQDLLRDRGRPRGWALGRSPFYLETSVPGIFAAGDARHGATRRVASAVGEGAIAIGLVHQYLKTV